MGQKVNPYGIRLGINKTWSSRWFSKNEYTKLLHQDLKIKKYVEKKLKNASISKINIERAAKKLRLSIYSSRPGTKSSTEVDDTPISVKKERLLVLQEKLKKIQYSFNKQFCNKTVKVLIENQSLSNPEYYFGRTPFMQSVYIKSNDLVPGYEKDIDITSCNHKSLYGIC